MSVTLYNLRIMLSDLGTNLQVQFAWTQSSSDARLVGQGAFLIDRCQQGRRTSMLGRCARLSVSCDLADEDLDRSFFVLT